MTAVINYFIEIPRARRSPRVRHNAVGTEIVATFLDLDKCPGAVRKKAESFFVEVFNRFVSAQKYFRAAVTVQYFNKLALLRVARL